MLKDPFGKYSGLSETIRSMLRADNAAEVYAQIHRLLDRNLSIICLKVIEHSNAGSPFETIWSGSASAEAAELFPVPPEALADIHAFPCVRTLPVEEETRRQTNARSIILVSIEPPDENIHHTLLIWVPDAEADHDPSLLMLLRVMALLAAQILGHHALRRAQTQEHKLFAEILESVPQAILAVSQEGRILASNRNAEFIFRVTRADLLGKPYSEALPPPLAEAMSGLIGSTAKGSDVFDSEFEFAVDRKTKLPFGISLSSMLDQNHRPSGYVFVIRDLSLQHEAQKLRELRQRNLDFVHTVSHEIKAPLTTIQLGTAELQTQRGQPDEDSGTMIQLINDSAKRIQELVNDLLDVAKLECGYSDLEAELGDLTAVAKKLVDAYRDLQKVDITLESAVGLPPLKFDRKKIHRALENLIINAIKYSLSTPKIRVRLSRQNDRAKVSVADEGIGIPPELLPFVWDKFYRALAPATTNVAGSGLGLTIVKHIVALHGGEVEATSEMGKGSVFSFTLPLRNTPSTSPGPASPA